MVGHLIMATMATLHMDMVTPPMDTVTTLMVVAMGMLGVGANPILVDLAEILVVIILIIRVQVWILIGEEEVEVDLVNNQGLVDPPLVCPWEEPCLLLLLLEPPCPSSSLAV